MRNIAIVILCSLIVITIILIPIIPKPLDGKIWSKDEFNSAQNNLRLISEKLKDIEPDKGNLYYIRVYYGETNVRASLIGLEWGTSQVTTAQYSCWIPRGCPYLVYEKGDTDIGHAILYPAQYDNFVKWANKAVSIGKYD
jgi:hypothetical protein